MWFLYADATSAMAFNALQLFCWRISQISFNHFNVVVFLHEINKSIELKGSNLDKDSGCRWGRFLACRHHIHPACCRWLCKPPVAAGFLHRRSQSTENNIPQMRLVDFFLLLMLKFQRRSESLGGSAEKLVLCTISVCCSAANVSLWGFPVSLYLIVQFVHVKQQQINVSTMNKNDFDCEVDRKCVSTSLLVHTWHLLVAVVDVCVTFPPAWFLVQQLNFHFERLVRWQGFQLRKMHNKRTHTHLDKTSISKSASKRNHLYVQHCILLGVF